MIKYPNKNFSPVAVFNLDKTSIKYYEHIQNVTGVEKLDPWEIKERKIQLKKYEKILADKDYELPEDESYYNKEIRRLKREIKYESVRDSKSIHEKSRVNVTRRIHLALNIIHKQLPEMALYLNKNTIKTGDRISYNPVPHDQPIWILKEEDLPTG